MIDKGIKRIIVVLGMHRSGTSTVTRGLQVMGVDLGDKLMQGMENVNPKGFCEDLDLCRLNCELLETLGSDWHHLAPIAAGDMDNQQENSDKAASLLSQKMQGRTIFGFKDPRIIKLLSFWKKVFLRCELDVGYVLAMRHPLSVSESLTKRDGFNREKNYFLWLGHIIESLSGCIGLKRVLIDYDKLMLSPEFELSRIADKLNLKMNEGELKVYISDFLDTSLRHTTYTLDDLVVDEACPPLVFEIYSTLLEVASGKIELDDPALNNRIACWIEEYKRFKPILTLVDRIFAHNNILTCQAASFNQVAIEREGKIAELTRAVVEREGKMAELTQAAVEREKKMAELTQVLVEREEQIAGFKFQIDELYASTSWRLTQPIRAAKSVLTSSRFLNPKSPKCTD